MNDDEREYLECTHCCFAVSGFDPMKLDERMDSHMKAEHEPQLREVSDAQ